VSDGEKAFGEVVQGPVCGSSTSFQDDMFLNKVRNIFAGHIIIDEIKQKLEDMYKTTESATQLYSIHDKKDYYERSLSRSRENEVK
jgi:hypothetical protein